MSSPPVPLAVVTGGSGVIGSAVVRGFAGAGHRVAVLDRDPLPAELAALAGVEHQVCELAEADSVERAVAAVTREEPELRFIVGVAGGAIDDEVTAQRDGELPAVAAFRASVEENLMAQYVPLHALLPRLARASGDRAVVLVSSINALGGFGLPA